MQNLPTFNGPGLDIFRNHQHVIRHPPDTYCRRRPQHATASHSVTEPPSLSQLIRILMQCFLSWVLGTRSVPNNCENVRVASDNALNCCCPLEPDNPVETHGVTAHGLRIRSQRTIIARRQLKIVNTWSAGLGRNHAWMPSLSGQIMVGPETARSRSEMCRKCPR